MIRYAQITSDLWDPYRQVIPQEQLVSGINIKTVNNSNILGSGNLSVGTVKGVRVNNSSVVDNSGIANISLSDFNLQLKKYENSYTTVNNSTSTVSIGIANYSSTDILLIDINGLLLSLNEDYTIDNTNSTVTFATPLTGIGETVHFTVIRLESN